MTFDWTLSVGNLFTVVAVLFGAGGFYSAARTLAKDVHALKEDIKALNLLVMANADVKAILMGHETRIGRIERQVDSTQGHAERLSRLERQFDRIDKDNNK